MLITYRSMSSTLPASPLELSSCVYLLLDRLCILQTRKTDKNWQIQRMYHIFGFAPTFSLYSNIVLPGGLVRLAGLAEPTLLADRAWTLQAKKRSSARSNSRTHPFKTFSMRNVPKGTSMVLTLLTYLEPLKPLSKRGIQRHAICRSYAFSFGSALVGSKSMSQVYRSNVTNSR
ncbi:hypothetical protein ARMGADRAFT_1141709 [Armillaria gallica]|uniref:Heterokaryon incompatibility domain-containing protein n=1 Tax=Armillaria gallica TaxID=47427 RepID=A0A2H3D1D4_ARMGA|nr:hypothetical protein ARMGADRAFT_1141709 [Armillaria gallica]